MSDLATELKSIANTRRVVNSLLWVIVLGAVFYSLMTSTPLVADHSEWKWSGWVLGVITDAAFILSISADATLSRHGIKSGRWEAAFRWVTGAASMFLNTWSSVAVEDWVGVAIHSISPVILICAAEVSPVYRRKFRDLELSLTEQVTEVRVTKFIANKRTPKVTEPGSQVTQVQSSEVTGSEFIGSSAQADEFSSLTENQRAIRDGFMDERKASDVAAEIGLSASYVSRQYRKIREDLDLTA